MSNHHAYLLLQSIEKSQDFDFQNPLLDTFNRELRGVDHFMLDNFSDAISISYARKFIDQAGSLVIVCDKITSESLGALLPILNHCVKRENTQLVCVEESKLLKPFIKMMKGLVFDSYGDAIDWLVH